MRRVLTALVITLAILASCWGCATIVCGWRQAVSITSEPSGAEVVVTYQKRVTIAEPITPGIAPVVGHPRQRQIVQGTAPMVLKIPRQAKQITVTIRREGYEPHRLTIIRSFNTWVFGNIIIGGPLGLAVDLMTGAVYELQPGEIDVLLIKERELTSVDKYRNTVFLVCEEM